MQTSHKTKRKFDYPVDSFEVYDGDTVKVTIDRGFGDSKDLSVRLLGLDTPEIRTRDELEKASGNEVRSALSLWLSFISSRGPLHFHSVKKDKFAGRALGDLYVDDESTSPPKRLSAIHYLLTSGLCRPYDGGEKREWMETELRDIIERARREQEALADLMS